MVIRRSKRLTGLPAWSDKKWKPKAPGVSRGFGPREIVIEGEFPTAPFDTTPAGEDTEEDELPPQLVDRLVARLQAVEEQNAYQAEALDQLQARLTTLGGGGTQPLVINSPVNYTEVSPYGNRPFRTIQAAIDYMENRASATEPGVVVVHPGVYVEAVTMSQYVSVVAYAEAGTV